MFYQLPPVGNPVQLTANSAQPSSVPLFLSAQQTRFYRSGTAALAAALLAVKQLKNKSEAEVILPAYACPDLLSAVVFAGIKPVLVDLQENRPWLDLAQLAEAITDHTIAIIGVSLFGIAERWPQLRQLANDNDLVLIEDSAQSFPGTDEKVQWQGDFVVFSFGRGKPVSLLGGGAVFCKNAELLALLPQPKHAAASVSIKQNLLFGMKAKLYNALISPRMYWLPQALPFLHLGETRYHALQNIEAMDALRLKLLLRNLTYYQKDAQAAARCTAISDMLDSLAKVSNLPRNCEMALNRRLLRYPLLLDAACRDWAYARLKRAGLGPSILYPASLPKITGVGHLLGEKQNFPNAEAFASQLLTLPTHARVGDKDIHKMQAILKLSK